MTERQKARNAEADGKGMWCYKRISALPQVKPAPKEFGGAAPVFGELMPEAAIWRITKPI